MKLEHANAAMATPRFSWRLVAAATPIRPGFGFFYFYFQQLTGGIA
jgi:hypothetical protein